MKKYTIWSLLFLTMLLFPGCEKKESNKAQKGAGSEIETIDAGDLFADEIHFQYALYFLSEPESDPLVMLEKSLRDSFPSIELLEKEVDTLRHQYLFAQVLESTEYPPQDSTNLIYFGRGLDSAQKEKLQKSPKVLVIDFLHPKELLWKGMKEANRLVYHLGNRYKGLIWDEETRETYSPEQWKLMRVESWKEEIPQTPYHFTIHAYQSGDYLRGITLGMRKMGLPDIVVNDFPRASSKTVESLINLCAQQCAEGIKVNDNSELNLNIKSVVNSSFRALHQERQKGNATSKATVTVAKATVEEGDPDNRIIELLFKKGKGNDHFAKLESTLNSLYGWSDTVDYVSHDEQAIMDASNKAKAQLPRLREYFNGQLKPGEFIMVKAPFQQPDGGSEWMWVEVSKWEGSNITGILSNEPFHIPDLHSGQEVIVKEEDIFDYIQAFADGRREGNFTGPIIQKMSIKRKGK